MISDDGTDSDMAGSFDRARRRPFAGPAESLPQEPPSTKAVRLVSRVTLADTLLMASSRPLPDLLRDHSERHPFWLPLVFLVLVAACLVVGVVGLLIPVITGIP